MEDLERLVRVRKYRHCEAEYSQLAKEPNTMPEVRDRYLRIAQYYRELAETEPLARISHTTECIGVANQRKPLCRNNSSSTRGAPRCRQSVARISLDLNLLKAARW